jgi:hypothetical protein
MSEMSDVSRFVSVAVLQALSVVEESEAVWLRRDVYSSMDMYREHVYRHNIGAFRYDVIGYTGYNPTFHEDVDCHAIAGNPKRIPETKALKWDYVYCQDCTDRSRQSES